MRRAVRGLLSRYYARAERIIAISQGVAEDVARMARGSDRHMEVIFNAGVDERVIAGASQPLDPADERPEGPLLVACGRLVEQKGFVHLLEAFARVRQCVPNATL